MLPTITSTDNGKSPIVRNGEWGLSFIDEDFHKIEISENNKGWGSDMSNLVFNKDGSFTSNDKAARLYLPEYVSMGKTVTVNIKGSSDSDFRVWLASGGYRASNLWESAEDANFSIGQPFDITIELTAEDADNKGAEQATMICFMGANYNAYLQNLNITSMSIKYSGNTSGSIKQSDKGVANGVATLDESGKVPSEQLPSMDYVPISEKSQAGGVASLDADGKVPSDQLPAMDYIPTNQKGVANGVATLGSGGKIPTSQIPSLSYISTSQKGAAGGVATLDSEGKVPIGSIPVDEITGTLELIATMSLTPKTYTYEVTQDNLGQAFSLSDVLISFDEITMDNGPKFSFKHGSDYADAKEIHYSGNAAIKPTSTRKYSGWIDYKHTDIGWIPSCRIASDPISSGAKYFCGLWSPTINTDTNLVNGVKLEMETTTTSSSTGTIYIYGVRA